MCSATHDGLRVRRSKEDVRDAAGRRSATGPGKPYCKRPFGSTGGEIALGVYTGVAGTGAGGVVPDGEATEVAVVGIEGAVSRRFGPNIAALSAAPEAALAAATIARVVLDMVV